MKTFREIVDIIKENERLRFDVDVEKLLEIDQIGLKIFRNTVPFQELLSYCNKKEISLNWLLSGEGSPFLENKRPPQKRFNFSGKLSDKEKKDLLRMIDSDDGIGRVLYTFLNGRRRQEPVEEERRRS
jgi:hypothetical protein